MFETVTSYEDSEDAGIVILISVSAGLKGNERLNLQSCFYFIVCFSRKKPT